PWAWRRPAAPGRTADRVRPSIRTQPAEVGGDMAIMRKKNRPSGEIPTSSMADIAFLLLIFFLVTTVFDEERGLPIVLPEPQSEVEVSQKNILHLVVRADGLVDIRYGESPQVRTVRYNEVEAIWR